MAREVGKNMAIVCLSLQYCQVCIACLKLHLYNTEQYRALPHHSELDQDLGRKIC